MSRWQISLVFGSVIALAVAGCGAGQQPRVASAGRKPVPAASVRADLQGTYVDGVRKFVKCARAHGMDVSDPDSKGRFTFRGDVRALKSDPKFSAAQQKCASLLPPIPAELQDNGPPQSAKQIDAARRYAKCMRAHGAPDFPDPGPDGYFPDKPWNQESAGAQHASRICEPIVGAPASPGPGVG